jgi:putative oxidoreductase
MTTPQYPKQNPLFNIFLLIIRLWLGQIMISGGQSILRFFSSQELRDFFVDWFGEQMGFPFPLLMAFVAKSTEFLGGILISLGLFTRISASLVAVVMLVATFAANIDYTGEGNFIRQDGLVTIPCFLFACLLVFTGAGKFSIDQLIKNRFKLRPSQT